jgi:hypothetical protein
MTRKPMLVAVVTLVALLITATMAFAAVTFDADSGEGFVGKGDVQNVYGWSNAQLQTNAGSVQFRYNAEEVTEVSWTCTKTVVLGNGGVNEIVELRETTTTTSTAGVVTTVARERNQITGFNLTGYSMQTVSSVTDGDEVNTCPDSSSGFVLTSPAGDPVVVDSSGGLQVSIDDGENWFDLE